MNYECPQSVTKVKTSGSVWAQLGTVKDGAITRSYVR